jgi:sigma-54 dependent transcriptional regulator, acetoin dehydrogenase operon transcriptional activator AcoR
VQLPALRERLDKLELILAMLAAESEAQATLAPELLARLMAHPWPGNLRQLRHVLRTAVALADGQRIELEHVPSLAGEGAGTLALQAPQAPEAAVDDSGRDLGTAPPGLNLIQVNEREVVLRLLHDQRWNVSNVAKALHVSRNTLYRKLHKLHIPLTHPR